MDPRVDTPLPDGGRCPACGGPLEREPRQRLERLISVVHPVHRYRCVMPSCGWHGVLGRDAVPAAHAVGRPAAGVVLLWFLAGAVTAVGLSEGTRAVLRWRKAHPAAVATAPRPTGAELDSHYAPPGIDHPGVELPATDGRVATNPSPLTLRRSCAWGVPGANPYRGTVEQALAAAKLPASVVREIADKAERGWMVDQVEISRHGIRSVAGRKDFNPNIQAMAFGDKLCFDTRVNFPAGHVEYAALYEARGENGETLHVMVPYVCRNVSVLGERYEVPDRPPGRTPTPGSLVLSLLGLAALVGSRRDRGTPAGQ